MISGGAGNYLNELAIFQYFGKGDKVTARRNPAQRPAVFLPRMIILGYQERQENTWILP